MEFSGKTGETASVRVGMGSAVRHVGLVGMGEPSKEGGDAPARALGSSIATLAKATRAASVGAILPEGAAAEAVAMGLVGSLYSDNRFRTGGVAPQCSFRLLIFLLST